MLSFPRHPCGPRRNVIHIIGESWEILNLLTIVVSSTAGALVVISV